jgi:molybdopterin/thiamine biosynthesis adenylyltransferase
VNAFAVNHQIPWMRVGYQANIGICGPIIVPNETFCQGCIANDQNLISDVDDSFLEEFNGNAMVPSFGPLNGIISSIAAREIIFLLAGAKSSVTTLGSVLLFDVANLEHRHVKLNRTNDCKICQRGQL